MKKVSFHKDNYYDEEDIAIGLLDADVIERYFKILFASKWDYKCTESFTAEITVKIVPYEQV